MDSFRLCVALGPLAVYLLFLGLVNLSRRPVMISGARDTFAFGIGVCGLVFVGPIELFLPESALAVWGYWVWPILLMMYFLVVTLCVLLARPRLTIYNISPGDVRPLLAEIITTLDPDARWAGNSLLLPRLHVELHLDCSVPLRNVSLVAVDDAQSLAGWQRLAGALAGRLRPSEGAARVWGSWLVAAALAMFALMGCELIYRPQAVTQGFQEVLGP